MVSLIEGNNVRDDGLEQLLCDITFINKSKGIRLW